MKKFLHIFLLLLPIMAFPQGTPQGISYQAVAYDSEGFEISNQDISVRLGILLGGVDAEASYSEVHSVTTDDFGLFSLVISQGETSDTFSSINWEEGAYLKVEVDEDLDGDYSVMGVSSFNAVPYALSAPTQSYVDSLLNVYNYKFDLLSRPLQVSLNMEFSISELFDVGFQKEEFIGLNFQGGIIFYIDNNASGLIAAPEDIGYFQWGCYNENVNGADLLVLGSGYSNTMNILDENCLTQNGGLSAAQAATQYENDGYTDWYLPSKEELNEMYLTISQFSVNGNIGGFDYNLYWSSSEKSLQNAWNHYFSNIDETVSQYKHNASKVRPIRSF